ncbi:MAG TPA: hypothetical protein VGW39_14645 [Chthoniobacterales bacterium]|nr:hypothetical protein [Chthoniobacterales bacterium]
MKRRFFLPALLSLLPLVPLLPAQTAAPDADALKERIVEHARTVTAEDYAYTRTVRTEGVEGDKKEQGVLVDRWDPAKPLDQRWTLISIDGKPPDADQLKLFRKALARRRQAYYGRVAGYFAKPATSAVDANGRTIFRFASLPKESVMVSDADISANATGEVVVDTSGPTPFIEEVRFTSTKPTRVKLIAKIDRFEAMTRYRLMPDGKPVPIESTSEMVGSMLGKEGRIRTRIAYTDHRAAGK